MVHVQVFVRQKLSARHKFSVLKSGSVESDSFLVGCIRHVWFFSVSLFLFWCSGMLLKNIFAGYGKLFLSLIKVMGLFLLCGLFALVIVLPLWKFAVSHPQMYTFFVLTLVALGVVFFAFRSIKLFFTKESDTQQLKAHYSRFFLKVGKVVLVFLGVVGVLYLVLINKVALALLLLLLVAFLYGILAFGMGKKD